MTVKNIAGTTSFHDCMTLEKHKRSVTPENSCISFPDLWFHIDGTRYSRFIGSRFCVGCARDEEPASDDGVDYGTDDVEVDETAGMIVVGLV